MLAKPKGSDFSAPYASATPARTSTLDKTTGYIFSYFILAEDAFVMLSRRKCHADLVIFIAGQWLTAVI
jgi:hypothetical protein